MKISKEYELVVKPLKKWFDKKKNWNLKYLPNHHISETGWDLEMQRKNMDILIEAKYINGPFAQSFSGLMLSPISNRRQHSIKTKYRSWCYNIAWAIGANDKYNRDNFYQLFDYLSGNIIFWKHYSKDLRVKYIYIINNKKITQLSFKKIIEMAKKYKKQLGKDVTQTNKRKTALNLFEHLER
jgi:hypothetical protein